MATVPGAIFPSASERSPVSLAVGICAFVFAADAKAASDAQKSADAQKAADAAKAAADAAKQQLPAPPVPVTDNDPFGG